MPEWIKILITAIVSFSAAVVLDMVREVRLRRRTIKMVANEVNSLALTMEFFLSIREAKPSSPNPLTQRPVFDTERYDYAYDRERNCLYELPDWGSLKRFYGAVKSVPSTRGLTDDEVDTLLMEFALFEDRIRNGILGHTMKSVLIDNKLSHLPKVAARYVQWRH